MTKYRRLSDAILSLLSERVAAQLGLHYPRNRWRDLEHGLDRAAAELGFADLTACGEGLARAPLSRRQIDVLASHLTIGETYFFRDKASFEVLEHKVLPDLIRSRRGSNQSLRLWSAGCCTGEEPYSLAILLRSMLWDRPDWQITILASDINPQFLRRATAGVYRHWSFREAAPWAKERYFRRTSRGEFEILPEIKQMVHFLPLNLAADDYPSAGHDTGGMDVIFCRNLLMYFAPGPMRRVVERMQRCLADGGWLFVSPTEASPILAEYLTPVHFPNALTYRRERRQTRTAPASGWQAATLTAAPQACVGQPARATTQARPTPPVSPAAPDEALARPAGNETVAARATRNVLVEQAVTAYERGRYAEAVEKATAALADLPGEAQLLVLLARICANEGKLDEALSWCEQAIERDRLDASTYYLLGVIQQEQGQDNAALAAWRRALYLKADYILAHFALGNLALRQGKRTEADRCFDTSLALLERYDQEEPLPEAGGLTAGRLKHMILTIRQAGA